MPPTPINGNSRSRHRQSIKIWWACKQTGHQSNVPICLNPKLCLTSCMAIYKSVILSSLSNFPSVWLFCGTGNVQKLDRLWERPLQFASNDRSSSYEILLKEHVLIYLRCLEFILPWRKCTFKFYYSMAPQYAQDLFVHKEDILIDHKIHVRPAKVWHTQIWTPFFHILWSKSVEYATTAYSV